MRSRGGLKLYNRVYHSSFASLFQAKSLHFHVNILNSPRACKRGSFRALSHRYRQRSFIHISRDASSFKCPIDLWTRRAQIIHFRFILTIFIPISRRPARSQSAARLDPPNPVVNNRRDSGSIGVTRAHTALNLLPSILSCPFSGGACSRALGSCHGR